MPRFSPRSPLGLLLPASLGLLLSACGGGSSTSTTGSTGGSSDPDANVLLTNNRLGTLSIANPASLTSPSTLSGIAAGETLVSIDRRPQNGMLYGLGYNATLGTVQLYSISVDNNQATPVGTTGTFVASNGVTPVYPGNMSSSTRFEMDFNPSVDRLRVVNSAGQNFRINPNTGAFIDGDGVSAGVQMDGAINGSTTTLDATAYTNNALNSTLTTQYTLDATSGTLNIQNPPNNGTQTLALTLAPTLTSVLGFDIAPGVNAGSANSAVSSGSGVAVVKLTGSSSESLASINLVTGAISNTRNIGSGGIIGLALQKPTSVPIVALTSTGNLLRFYSGSPGTTTTVSVTGLTAGETLAGIDYRPSTGQLYGFGVNATANTGTLYLLDPQTGAATVVGLASLVAFVNALGNAVDLPDPATAGYGFNFNPVADRIRITTSTGLNFRLNPVTGAAVDGDLGGALGSVTGVNPDGTINGDTTGVGAVAYTNSSGGTTVTTLYTLDSGTGGLYIQSPPNSGTQGSLLLVRLNGSLLNFGPHIGFDIQAQVKTGVSNTGVNAGSAHAALTVGGSTHLYTISLLTGAATDLGAIGSGSTTINALAVGQTKAL
jgi:hypothetical protein